jgi:hypothetical protein
MYWIADSGLRNSHYLYFGMRPVTWVKFEGIFWKYTV